jgi:hypothetical protein
MEYVNDSIDLFRVSSMPLLSGKISILHSRVAVNIPGTLKWDLWLGYDPGLLPVNWRIYDDFGNGVIGDIGCHMMDSAYWGLDLPAPDEIEASTIINNCYPFPVSSVVTYKFPCRGGNPSC